MSEGGLRAGIAALALSGAAVSGYLLAARYGDVPLSCTTGGCEAVQSSRYAEVFGFPVAGLGLLGYLLVLATALARGPLAQAAGAALALAAAGFSAYLLVIQLAVIGAVRDWCLASDALTSLVAVLAFLRLRAGIHAAAQPARAGRVEPPAARPSLGARREDRLRGLRRSRLRSARRQ